VLAKGDLVMDKTYVYSNSDQLYFDYGDDKDDGAGCDD